MNSKPCNKCNGLMFMYKDTCLESSDSYVHYWRCLNCSKTEWLKPAQYKAVYIGEISCLN